MMSFSAGASSTPAFTVKKFESQNEVDEKKKKRQEEWEKVRKPEDPEECPEEPVDNRCLYDKLEEQRLKKQEEYEEKVAFRNQVRRLDADETDFLDFCTERQQEILDERKMEEKRILTEMRDAKVVKVEETSKLDTKKRPTQSQATKKSQQSLLAGAVKRKQSDDVSTSKKIKPEATETSDRSLPDASPEKSSSTSTTGNKMAQVVAVLPVALPGLTNYEDSSDSVSSSSDSEPDFSLSARNQAAVIVRQHQAQQ